MRTSSGISSTARKLMPAGQHEAVDEDDEGGLLEVLQLGRLDLAVNLGQRLLAAHRQDRMAEGDEDADHADQAQPIHCRVSVRMRRRDRRVASGSRAGLPSRLVSGCGCGLKSGASGHGIDGAVLPIGPALARPASRRTSRSGSRAMMVVTIMIFRALSLDSWMPTMFWRKKYSVTAQAISDRAPGHPRLEAAAWSRASILDAEPAGAGTVAGPGR